MTNFEQLYELSDKINKKLDKLFTLTINGIIASNSMEYEALIEEIKILVLKESALVSSLEREDVDICLTDFKYLLKKNFEVGNDYDLNELTGIEACLNNLSKNCVNVNQAYNIDVLLRVIDRLKNRISILYGDGLRLKLKQNGNELIKYEVCLWDVVTSELYLEGLKSIKDKIFALVPCGKGDKEYIKELKFNLECFKMSILFKNFTTEIKALYANGNLDKIGVIGIDNLKKSKIFDQENFGMLLLEEAKILANELSNIYSINNNPVEVFEFLANVTLFETMIKYMDLATLRSINEYCQSISTKENNPCMSGINKFVRARIRKEERK